MATGARYAISKKLADGGMAEIFLATLQGAEGFQRPVILKRILPTLSADPKFRNLLVDEAHVAMTLTHGNIAQVLDLGQAAGRYFLVLELVDGWDLHELIERARDARLALPLPLALYIAAEVCRGLAYAHNKKREGRPLSIVHRDISPQNILVSAEAEVKVTDFGIAKALGRREDTKSGYIKGKVDFMSPEQANGKPVDARSDLFSLGSVLYLMVTDRLPFEARTQLESLLRTQDARYDPPQKWRPGLDPEITAIITRALAGAPEQRFANANEMMTALEEVLRNDFGAAGRSELQGWLDELGRRDRAPTISQAPGLAVEPAALGMAPDKTVELEGVEVQFAENLADPPMGLAHTTPMDTASVASLALATDVSRPRKKTWLRNALVLAVVTGAAWVAISSARRQAVVEGARGAWQRGAGALGDTPPVPTERSTVRIVSKPMGAKVERGGAVLGTTPFVLTARVGTMHELAFSMPGFASVARRITVSPDATTLEVELTPNAPSPSAPVTAKKKKH